LEEWLTDIEVLVTGCVRSNIGCSGMCFKHKPFMFDSNTVITVKANMSWLTLRYATFCALHVVKGTFNTVRLIPHLMKPDPDNVSACGVNYPFAYLS